MSAFAAIRRFLVEFDEALDHARTGRTPERVKLVRRDSGARRVAGHGKG